MYYTACSNRAEMFQRRHRFDGETKKRGLSKINVFPFLEERFRDVMVTGSVVNLFEGIKKNKKDKGFCGEVDRERICHGKNYLLALG